MNISGLENKIQSWIAVQSEHSCQLAGDVFVVCTDDLSEFIKNLFEKENEKLEGCVVVPKTIPENVVKMLECSGYHWGDGTRDYFTPLYSMIVEEAARGGK